MKKLFSLISVVVLFSCNKTPISPNCNCVEYHEKYDFINGTMNMAWQFNYQTDSIPDLCEKDNGTYIYNSNNTQRYKYICH